MRGGEAAPPPPLPLPLLLLLLVLLLLLPPASPHLQRRRQLLPTGLSVAEAEAACAPYTPLWSDVPRELSRWSAAGGIDLAVVEATVREHSTRSRNAKGFAAGFRNGTAFVEPPKLRQVGHHAPLLFTYMRMLVHLQDSFQMPDLDMVISTVDRPLQLSVPPSASDHPVFRFCKTDSHSDLLIPIFHFHTKQYDKLLAKAEDIHRSHPWDTRTDKVFGRFSGYSRHASPMDAASPERQGAGGADICAGSSRVTRVCQVRAHFAEWCASHASDFDVRLDSFKPMEHHARFKYLVHLDGQGLSSRLDQLFVMRSLVLKEESGYRAFYHHLLKPYEHYVPFWKQRPEDALDALSWARSNDADAAAVAAAGQQLAVKYLGGRARACYWYHLLREYAGLLKYEPGRREATGLLRGAVPATEYLATTASEYEGGKHRVLLRNWAP